MEIACKETITGKPAFPANDLPRFLSSLDTPIKPMGVKKAEILLDGLEQRYGAAAFVDVGALFDSGSGEPAPITPYTLFQEVDRREVIKHERHSYRTTMMFLPSGDRQGNRFFR